MPDKERTGEKKIKLVVFDWAGTTVDYASSASMHVLADVFEKARVPIPKNRINAYMGMEKKEQIRLLLSEEPTDARWQEAYRRPRSEEDVERIYKNFEKELHDIVVSYSDPIPGVVDTVKALRRSGLKIGSTTCCSAQMMEQVLLHAKERGYEPDCVVTLDDIDYSRATPFMIFECMRRLHVYPPTAVVKVGDTLVDMEEGKNAGAWSIGILTGSNLLGLSEEEYYGLDPHELQILKDRAKAQYKKAGADLVIDSVMELPGAIETINARMREMR